MKHLIRNFLSCCCTLAVSAVVAISAAFPARAETYTWNGASGADWATPASWLVGGATATAAPGSGDTIRFESSSASTVGGSGTLTVTKIVTATDAAVTFSCPVAFADTYLVENTANAPVFAAGATATYPDDSLTSMNAASHILPDGLVLTADWTVPTQASGTPFVVPAGASITGQKITGTEYKNTQPCIRIDEGAVATFTEIPSARRFVFWLNGGRLVVTGDILWQTDGGARDFGYYAQPNIGTVEANGFYKSAQGDSGRANIYVTNMVVGAGGFGMKYAYNDLILYKDLRLTFKDDSTIWAPLGGDYGAEDDGYLNLNNGKTFTVDTAGHAVDFNLKVGSGAGKIVKEGLGELIMQRQPKQHTSGTDVKGGKLTVSIANGAGNGPMKIYSGATLAWTTAVSGVTTLTLEDGAILKPTQGATFSASSLSLPDSGAVTVDLSDFSFTDGVAVPLLSGASAGDEAKFTAALSAGVQGAFSVNASGSLCFTSGSAADLYWNATAGLTEWSASAAAWTNATGMAMAFADYANATIADAASISIPSDVTANDVTVSADGDVTLSGAGKIGGAGTFTKSGTGTLTFNATGGLDGQTILITNGVFKVGDDLTGHALGDTSDSSPIIVRDGGTLDLNYRNGDNAGITRDKLIRISGDGYNGQGALISSVRAWRGIGDLVLDGDASIGGSEVIHVCNEGFSQYVRNNASIYGPGKTLTVKGIPSSGDGLLIRHAALTLGEIDVDGSALSLDGRNGGNTYNIANGIHLKNGGRLKFQQSPSGIPAVTVDSGNCEISGDATIPGAVTVASGATLKQTGGNITYKGAVNGLEVTGGSAKYAGFGGEYIRFVQDGGTLDYSGSGFSGIAAADWSSDGANVYNGTVLMNGGTFNASGNWAVNHYIPLLLRNGTAGGWTLNQASGTTATWHTALTGDGDVTLSGAATLVGDKEVQGAAGGKWTVGAGFTAGLEGAASLLGGLDLGAGATATIDIAADRSAVFTARDFTSDLTASTSITNRFNRKPGGTTRGTVTHDETFLFTHYDSGARPFGNIDRSAAYAVGQFYVEADAAGTWYFAGKCDDRVALWIDGELVMISGSNCANVEGSKNLAAGWHSFRHIASDNGGGFGPDASNNSNYRAYHTVGYKYGSMADYARFNVKNLKMRPAADMGDPDNANTVRWSHYKGTSSDVTASTYKRDDFAWDFCSITNTLDMIQWKGGSSTYMNGYTVNRYEGWFLVTAENADKEWTFHSQYDDQCAMWIDGVDTGLTGANADTPTYTVALSRGWHSFRIQTADFTGDAGPWNTAKSAVSYKVADGAETQFSEATLQFSLCPDGYVQGNVTLASGATLRNGAGRDALVASAAVVHGNVIATGTGATVDGAFKFDGGALAFRNVDPAARDLTTMLAFANQPADYLADVGAITVDFTAKPTRAKVKVCPAGGLTVEAAAEKLTVTVDGEPVDRFQCVIENGDLKICLSQGFTIYVR